MKTIEVYNINNEEYYLLDTVNYKEDTYLYFSNISKGDDYIIRKLDRNDSSLMIPLDDEEEVQLAILLLTNKQVDFK